MNKRTWLLLLLTMSTLGACKSPNGLGTERPQVDAAQVDGGRASARAGQGLALPKGDPQPKLPTGQLEIEMAPRAPVKLTVEVATTDRERQVGMMFRRELGEDEGMLFAFPTERYNNFWMHNTLIPLDMIFIDGEWNVVGVVENATPLTDDPRGVEKMSRYVLEVNGGFAAQHDLDEGAKIRFVPPQGVVMP